jgi:anti-anti-sigma factor
MEQFVLHRSSGQVLLTCSGDLDLVAQKQFEAACDQALAAAPRRLVVDLDQVRHLDCASIRLLVRTRDVQQARGGHFTLVCRQPFFRRLVLAAGLAPKSSARHYPADGSPELRSVSS